jgi:flagellar protein FliO/FliZ
MGMNWTAVWWFAAVLASIPLVLWLLKRSQLIGTQPIAGTARTVAVLPLSASQKVVTVEVGRGEDKTWLVLGVTPSAITTLHTMAALAPLELAAAIAPTVPGGIVPAGDSADADAARGRGESGGAHGPHGPHGPPSATFAQLLGRLRRDAAGGHGR